MKKSFLSVAICATLLAGCTSPVAYDVVGSPVHKRRKCELRFKTGCCCNFKLPVGSFRSGGRADT